MVSKIKKKLKPKIKKRRPKAAQVKKTEDAGEHQTRLLDPEPIIKLGFLPDKTLKRWRVVIDATRFYYRIHLLTMEETVELCRELGPRTQYFSLASFSRAKRFLYQKVRSDIQMLTSVAAGIRTLRKSEYDNS